MLVVCGQTQFEWSERSGRAKITTSEGSSVSVPISDMAYFIAGAWCAPQAKEKLDAMPWGTLLEVQPPEPLKKKK